MAFLEISFGVKVDEGARCHARSRSGGESPLCLLKLDRMAGKLRLAHRNLVGAVSFGDRGLFIGVWKSSFFAVEELGK